MPVTVELTRQGRVVLQTYRDPLEMAHMDALKSQMNQEILSGAIGKVHIIADFRQVHNLPRLFLAQGSRMVNDAHANTGIIVVIVAKNAQPLLSRLVRVFLRLTDQGVFQVVSSLDEALQIIDATLAKEPPSGHQ